MDQALQIIAAHSQDGMQLRESFFKKEAAQIVEIAKIMAVALPREIKSCSAATEVRRQTHNTLRRS